jgi:glutathione synthase/RimK-type ligase-like ATP-grasp enzyme
MHVVIIGNPENRRVTAFVAELIALKEHTFSVVSYLDLLDNVANLAQYILPHSIIKIESSGENSLVRKRLIEYGKSTPSVYLDFLDDFGRICYVEEWYQGFSLFLWAIKKQLQALETPHYLMNDIDSILTMFDKVACKEILLKNNIPTPRSLGVISDYAALRQQMHHQHINSVFIKPAHSSSASGVIAFRTNGSRVQAVTSIELSVENGEIVLHNSLKVRTYSDEATIISLIEAILKSKNVVEQWIPKATFKGFAFDFRIVVINGRARHTVARMSKSPITNLHLGNSRGNLLDIIAYIGISNFDKAKKMAEQVAGCFPDCLYMGVDILVSSNLKSIKVLEVNAFGDLLPQLMDEGENVYQAEISSYGQLQYERHSRNNGHPIHHIGFVAV